MVTYFLSVQELTVRHLQKLAAAQRLVLGARSPVEELARFRQGYATCAQVGGKGMLVDILILSAAFRRLPSFFFPPLALI